MTVLEEFDLDIRIGDTPRNVFGDEVDTAITWVGSTAFGNCVGPESR